MRPTAFDSLSPPQPLDGGVTTPGDVPFDEQWELIRKSQRIQLEAEAGYWKAQHAQAKRKIAALERSYCQIWCMTKGPESDQAASRCSCSVSGGSSVTGIPSS